VEVFGCSIQPGQLVHADKHGFLVVPEEDQAVLLEAVRFMDENECTTVIPAARGSAGKSFKETLTEMNGAGRDFKDAVRKKFHGSGN
jgi:regulator of RNase E activity RraA